MLTLDLHPDSPWINAGLGSERWYRGVLCHVVRAGGLAFLAQVDARRLSSTAPQAGALVMGESDARAWCERWAEVIAQEYDAAPDVAALAREYLAAQDAYDAAQGRPIDDSMGVGGWVRMHDVARERVRRTLNALEQALGKGA